MMPRSGLCGLRVALARGTRFAGQRPPLGERHLDILGCTRCAGQHPSCPFTLSGPSVGQRGILRSIHLLSCTYNTSYVRILMLFDIFLHSSVFAPDGCYPAILPPAAYVRCAHSIRGPCPRSAVPTPNSEPPVVPQLLLSVVGLSRSALAHTTHHSTTAKEGMVYHQDVIRMCAPQAPRSFTKIISYLAPAAISSSYEEILWHRMRRCASDVQCVATEA
jgi:hypothetical protein